MNYSACVNKKKVAIGMLGPVLDYGKKSKRWERWRPTVALCQHENLLINRFELLYQEKFTSLLDRIVEDIGHVSPETQVIAHKVDIDDPWDFEQVFGMLHDFAKSYPFDPDKEEYLIHITTGTHVVQICMFLLTESRYFPGKIIQTGPSTRKDGDPCGRFTIIDLDLSKYDQIAMRFQQEIKDDISFLKSGIETKNRDFNILIEQIERVAVNSVDPILLTGPTGAGKSRLARRIYDLKKTRRQMEGNFAEINCATLRGDAAMSALFGHKKGAFTGAAHDRDGLLRTADKGMLFLDEVGELGMDEQSMLLRAIEEKRFLPLGSDRETSSDFQLICGTNRDLWADTGHGRFREDLLSRINLWTFNLPGLKDRHEDIEPNLDYELDRFAERTGNRVSFNLEARKLFLDFAVSGSAMWSANFRDLSGAVTRMSTLADSGRIRPDDVKQEIARLSASWNRTGFGKAGFGKTGFDTNGFYNNGQILNQVLGSKADKLDPFDRIQLAGVLKICKKSKSISEAGRELFSFSRLSKKTPNDADRLRKYLARFGILWNDLYKD